MFNASLKVGYLPESMSRALVVLLLKPGKDPLDPSSYRPISLLQSDVKLLAKVLALRMNEVVLSVVHQDQVGFMPCKLTSVNLQRLFINIQTPVDNMGNGVLLSLDAHKAFEGVYLWLVLAKFSIEQSLYPGFVFSIVPQSPS